MRYVAIAIILAILVAVVMWGLVGFVALSWNMLAWPGIGRFGFVFCWAIACVPCVGITTECIYNADKAKAKRKKLGLH